MQFRVLDEKKNIEDRDFEDGGWGGGWIGFYGHVLGLGFRVEGLRFRVYSEGFRVKG